MDVSESTEMYLLKAAVLEEAGAEAPVPVPQLADELGISQVSVNQMCRKLEEHGLLRYQPYRGVTLTETGLELANQVIRRRRLWEVFLHEKLGLSVAGAVDAACKLEHATTCDISDRLDDLLDHPRVCPHDKPIPPGRRQTGAPSSRAATARTSSLARQSLTHEPE